MIRAWHTGTSREDSSFEKARAQERLETVVMNGKAVRTVAHQAVDANDFRRLVSMLGLDENGEGVTRAGR
ncbi:MAG: hypothetical protein ACJ72N_15175 [Labedaea sp.]